LPLAFRLQGRLGDRCGDLLGKTTFKLLIFDV
jgi:hypothetical protein